jgi:hypothetical protein
MSVGQGHFAIVESFKQPTITPGEASPRGESYFARGGGELPFSHSRKRREELQDLLNRKALELSESPVKHLRRFLNAIFKLALSDGLVFNAPASELRIPKKCQPRRAMRPLTEVA